MIKKEIIAPIDIMKTYQWTYYWGGMRNWHNDPRCVVFDHELIYKPATGRCEVRTSEFHVSLTFDEQGRVSQHGTDRKMGIAVIGDSFAMGYGVNDDETFAAVLEKDLGRPVYNLGVASYATWRELRRLEKSGLIPRVDTVIVQYCNNDFGENKEGVDTVISGIGLTSEKSAREKSTRELFDLLGAGPSLYTMSHWTKTAVKAPFLALEERFTEIPGRHTSGRDFSPEFSAMSKILSKFPWLNTKRVIIIYENGAYDRYSNFVAVGERDSPISATFVDVSLGPEFHYKFDGHLNRFGHRKTAEMLLPLLRTDEFSLRVHPAVSHLPRVNIRN
jgi:hypothetical protein